MELARAREKQRILKTGMMSNEASAQLARQRAMQYSRSLVHKFFPNSGVIGAYFGHQIVTGQSGVFSLVIRANFPKCFDNSRDTLSTQEASLDFRSALLHSQLPKSLSSMTAKLIYAYYELGMAHQRENDSPCSLAHKRVRPIQDYNGVLTRYTTSQRSIYQQLPIPKVHRLRDHAYSNILEIYVIASANGFPLGYISLSMQQSDIGSKYRNIWESPRALEIATWARRQGFPPQTKIIPYIVWRDDVECNWVKNNRGSVWLCTLSLVGRGSLWNSKCCTSPLCIGKSKDSHREAERLIHQEMRLEAAKPHLVYCGESHGEQWVALYPMFMSTDSPEKRKATMTSMGNATYHARFRCSADHNSLLPLIRPCDTCLKLMRDGKLPRDCDACANWDALTQHEPVQEMLKLSPRPHYPLQYLDNDGEIDYLTEDEKILPFKITYHRLKVSLRIAFENFAALRWSEQEVREFLAVECFNGKLVSEIIENGTNARIITQIKNGTSIEEELIQQLFLAEAEAVPEMYCAPPMPSVWNAGDEISIFVDSPMHLIFLGIVKSTLGVIKKWLESRGYLTDFFSHCQALNKLLEELKLDWLKIEDFREGKFGGWVSENFVGFSRIILWFFQDIGSLLRQDILGPDSIPPSERPNNSWKKKHYLRWLYDRGVTYRGTIAQMKVKILSLLGSPNGPPPVIDRTNQHKPEQLERVLLALDSMITALMVDEVEAGVTSKDAELKIKIFLSEFDILNQSNLAEDKKPKVISASNYLTLLNLPETLERFGPLRNLWEGNMHGEGYVRCVKPHFRFGQRDNFACHGMNHCLRESALDMAAQRLDSSVQSSSTTNNFWVDFLASSRASFRTYKSRKEITDFLFGRGVVSTIVILGPQQHDGSRETHMFVVERCQRTDQQPVNFQLYRLRKDLDKKTTKLSMRYYQWNVEASPTNFGDLLAVFPNPQFQGTFGCLLPLMEKSGEHLHMLVCRDRSVYI